VPIEEIARRKKIQKVSPQARDDEKKLVGAERKVGWTGVMGQDYVTIRANRSE